MADAAPPPRRQTGHKVRPADRRALRKLISKEREELAKPWTQDGADPAPPIAAWVETSAKAVVAASLAPTPKRLVGFDFDCTLTVRHFYKVFAWCYTQERPHAHSKAFSAWCQDHGVSDTIVGGIDEDDIVRAALEDFCRHAGEDCFREVVREVFFGGEERIALVAAWLKRLEEAGVEFAIVTAGTSTAVMRCLVTTPEWLCFFPSCRVWDTQQGRHSVGSVAEQKVFMLRDICPAAVSTLLVDDSLCRDRPPEWVLKAANVDCFELDYEGPGVSKEILDKIEDTILR